MSLLDELTSKQKSDTELKEIANGIISNEIFTSNHLIQMVKDPEDYILEVFIPLQFTDEEILSKMEYYDISLFYEYLENQSGTLPNGYPIFSTVQFLTIKEHHKVNSYVKELRNW